VKLPKIFGPIFQPSRYKIFYGGRGSGKSWAVADYLVNVAARKPLRVVCAREFQNSIEESVHRLLSDRIAFYKLPYTIEKYRIFNDIGSEFIFKGLSKQDAAAIKSLEGADVCWVEEAQNVSHASWQNLIPTLRKDGSEIIVTFNPDTADAPTYQRFVTNAPPNALTIKVNWNDNPWFPAVLEDERRHLKATDPAAYDNVWEGNPRTFSEGAYFREQMETAELEGRIGVYPHNPALRVWTFWDLGWADSMAVWFIQPDGSGFNAIDYWEGSNVDIVRVAREVIKGRKYNYALHVIPHDGGHGNRQTGLSDSQLLMRDAGLPVQVQPRTGNKGADVNSLRQVLARLRFNKDTTGQGLAALKGYRQELDVKTGLWKYKHDWTSHGVDALRAFAVHENTTGLVANNTVKLVMPKVGVV
jgi:phage terminase large subunit